MHCKLDLQSVITAPGAENGTEYATTVLQGTRMLQEGIVELLVRLGIPKGDETRFEVAYEEAARNGIEHGNLGADSKLRHEDRDEYNKYIEAVKDPGLLRRVLKVRTIVHRHLEAGTPTATLQVVIEDEGEGFVLEDVPDPTQIENLEKPCGRGLLLMRTYCDEVHYNETGNRVTLRRTFAEGKSREPVATDKTKESSEHTEA